MGVLDDDDRAAERAGYDVGLRGGEPDEATRPGAGAGGRQLGGWRAPEATEQPLRGLQIGQRLAWYAARRSA